MNSVIRRVAALVAGAIVFVVTAAAVAAPSGQPIRVGGTLALTGPLASTGIVHQLVADIFVSEINKQIQEDTPIWEHKRFLPVPALADGDGPILKFRKWYAQFYAEPMKTDA